MTQGEHVGHEVEDDGSGFRLRVWINQDGDAHEQVYQMVNQIRFIAAEAHRGVDSCP